MPSSLVTENQNSEGEDIPAAVKRFVGAKRKSKTIRRKATKRVKRATGGDADSAASHDTDYTTDSNISNSSSESNRDEIPSNAEVCSQL